MDVCNCCTRCLRVNGQTCGGVGYIVGRCGRGLKCNLVSATFKNPVGYCAPVLKPTDVPVQRLLTKVPFVVAGLQDKENFHQESGVTRQNIPGVPVDKMVENDQRGEQNLPQDNAKYFLHSSNVWTLDSVKMLNDATQPKVEMPLKNGPYNGPYNKTHTSDQRRKNAVNKSSLEHTIPDISPAVIFVAVSGAIFVCLIGLLLLPVPRERSASNNPAN